MKKTITLRLEYNYDVEYYKTFYDGLYLLSYTDSNYIHNIKNKQLIINYIYYLNKVAIF